jgi:protein-tyrosine phosphatase
MLSPYRVCFVCTGNICRSPMAEAVFRHLVTEAGLSGLVEVDSAGTDSWHVGEDADPRTVDALRARGYRGAHRARQFDRSWFRRRDLVVALDAGHLRALRRLAPDAETADRIRLLRSFDPAVASEAEAAAVDLDVPDPYYGDAAGFARCLDLVEAACRGLLDHVDATLARR